MDVNDDSDDHNSTSVFSLIKSTITPNDITPKTSRLFGSNSSSGTITSYFGTITFLDDQKEFDDVFGKNSIILGKNPFTESSSDCLMKVCLYADKCMLDVFLQICKDYYVGVMMLNPEENRFTKSVSQLQNFGKSIMRGEWDKTDIL